MGFDPSTATDRELRLHGLPRRPDPQVEPDLVREWERLLSEPLRYVRADLTIKPVVGGPSLAQSLATKWAGGAIRHPSFKWAFAEWVIPNVDTNKSVWDPAFALAFWVGLDGFRGDQVLQGGVAVQVETKWWFRWWLPPWPHVVVTWFAWSEWWTEKWEDDRVVIENFAVKPGDTVAFLVCAPDADSDTGSVFARNATTGLATTVGRKAPEGYAITGDSAEWVIEPKVKLPRFDPITFRECLAGSPTGQLALFGNAFRVPDHSAGEIIHVELQEPRSVTVTWTGGSGGP